MGLRKKKGQESYPCAACRLAAEPGDHLATPAMMVLSPK